MRHADTLKKRVASRRYGRFLMLVVRVLLDSTRMRRAPSAAAATAARQAADDDTKQRDNGVDDCLEACSNGVDNGHDAVSDGPELDMVLVRSFEGASNG